MDIFTTAEESTENAIQEAEQNNRRRMVVEQDGNQKVIADRSATGYPSITQEIKQRFNAYVEEVCHDERFG